MYSSKSIYQIALTQIKGIGIALARILMQEIGDEEAIFNEKRKSLEKIPRMSVNLVNEIKNPAVLLRAEEEMKFIEKNQLRLMFFTDDTYPKRLTHCVDAPILLYGKGNANLNASKVISIVGTRNSTRYGQMFCEQFIEDLRSKCADLIITSGLAYGIDVHAHRAAIKNELPTIGVLAHGLDRIYPAVHRNTAVEMIEKGALITEFPSTTNPDRHNFVRRNRIVAGMADAVVVIESGAKGGSLITADIANSYFREVFAVPGRTTDPNSIGCNNLISDNKAVLLQDANTLIYQMGWNVATKPKAPVQRELFLNLTPDEENVFQALNFGETKQVNTLAVELNKPVSELFYTLLEMEMKNIVQALPGGVYKLL